MKTKTTYYNLIGYSTPREMKTVQDQILTQTSFIFPPTYRVQQI